jgi:uncharacterized protein YggU (UPF0235/DUF167 family)
MGSDERKSYTVQARVHTGSSKRHVVVQGGSLHLYTGKKPVKGEANSDAVSLVSEYFKVPKSSVTILRGERAKDKLFRIAGQPAVMDRATMDRAKSKFLREETK